MGGVLFFQGSPVHKCHDGKNGGRAEFRLSRPDADFAVDMDLPGVARPTIDIRARTPLCVLAIVLTQVKPGYGRRAILCGTTVEDFMNESIQRVELRLAEHKEWAKERNSGADTSMALFPVADIELLLSTLILAMREGRLAGDALLDVSIPLRAYAEAAAPHEDRRRAM
jgi:hypothetical protein